MHDIDACPSSAPAVLGIPYLNVVLSTAAATVDTQQLYALPPLTVLKLFLASLLQAVNSNCC